ncbi:MAG: glycosyltransferase family 4 protein [Cocleimonas sp.]
MKIAFVIAHLKSGGSERAVSNMSLAMEKEGHDVSVILLDARDIGYPYGGKIIDVNSHHASSALGQVINLLKRAYTFKKVYKEQNFDGVFTFMESVGFPSVMASKDVIVSVHENPDKMSKMYKFLYPFLYPRAKKVIACSKAMEERLVDLYDLKNSGTIYNSVDIDLVLEKSKETIKETRPYILSVGRLVTVKGFDLLIEAYSKSTAKEKLDLIICGEGEERKVLQALIDKRGLTNNVTLIGSVENPFAYYASAEFYVLSSRNEGFPNILIEALACNCPCIAFDCKTGPNEIIKQGENGLLVKAENVPALTEAIDKLAEDKDLQSRFKENANSSVQHLTPSVIAQNWLSLLK